MEKLIKAFSALSNEISKIEESVKYKSDFADLTLTQLNYLENINQLFNPTLTELSVKLKLKKPTVKVAIDRLCEKGFIYRVKSDEDKRSAHLHLTARGLLINQMHNKAHYMMAIQFQEKLDNNEVEQFINIISKIFDFDKNR